ncbi:MAG: 16S rRNA (cytidine(1402)-2'-O)-methyltransferase [Vicinamibacteraceae bacterium]
MATPIGNLEDITLRAVRVLREVSLVAAEDTRRTGRLLNHLGIATRTVSLHEHNEHERALPLVERLLAGESIALVTDAGTPLLSDPGRLLTAAAAARGVRVEPIPGPSAVLTALAGSGIEWSQFAFLGFTPTKQNARRTFYREADALGLPFVAFEAPHRLRASLDDAAAVLRARDLVICRELTKIHEEFVRTRTNEAPEVFRSREVIGEFTLVFGAPEPVVDTDREVLSDASIWAAVGRLADAGHTRREAIAELARKEGRSSKDIYAAAERGKTAGEA